MSIKRRGKKFRISRPILITPEFLEVGNHVSILNNCRIEGITKYENKKFTPSIQLEDDVTIQQNVHITCANHILIKKNTAIAANVTITDIVHPYQDVDYPIEKQNIESYTVEIGEDSKIYNNAVILPGVKLGKHTVVAANSVVLANQYPDFCVLAGNPAKIVKKYNFKTNSWE